MGNFFSYKKTADFVSAFSAIVDAEGPPVGTIICQCGANAGHSNGKTLTVTVDPSGGWRARADSDPATPYGTLDAKSSWAYYYRNLTTPADLPRQTQFDGEHFTSGCVLDLDRKGTDATGRVLGATVIYSEPVYFVEARSKDLHKLIDFIYPVFIGSCKRVTVQYGSKTYSIIRGNAVPVMG